MEDDAGRFVFPTRRAGEEDVEPEERLAGLCSVPLAQGARVCARLEAEGIVCGARASAVSDGVFGGVHHADVFVREEDLEVAREVLARPPEDDDVAQDDAADVDARYVANWICPRCKRPGLDLLPVTRRVLRLREALAAV